MAAAPRLSEDDIQAAVFAQLNKRGQKGLIALHVPNGGVHQKSVGQRIQNKRRGVLAGSPDVLIFYRERLYCLELKTEKGRLTKAQGDTLRDLREQGAVASVAYGLDNAVQWLEYHGLLRGKKQ